MSEMMAYFTLSPPFSQRESQRSPAHAINLRLADSRLHQELCR
jgi:hypothetical protein